MRALLFFRLLCIALPLRPKNITRREHFALTVLWAYRSAF